MVRGVDFILTAMETIGGEGRGRRARDSGDHFKKIFLDTTSRMADETEQ